MKALLFFLLMIGIVPAIQNKKLGTFSFAERKGGHEARVVFKTRRFDSRNHKIAYANTQYLKSHNIFLAPGVRYVTRIDGRVPLGVDGSVPDVEIESLRFFYDGKEVAVPARLYADCYNPNLHKDYLAVRFDDEGAGIFIFMNGSDGAGTFDVIWVLRVDCLHSRLARPGGDCSFLNFDCIPEKK